MTKAELRPFALEVVVIGDQLTSLEAAPFTHKYLDANNRSMLQVKLQKKTIQAIANFSINAPTASATIPNAVVLPDLIQMAPIMPTQTPWDGDHSSPSTL